MKDTRIYLTTISGDTFAYDGTSMSIIPIPNEVVDMYHLNYDTHMIEADEDFHRNIQQAITEIPEGPSIRAFTLADRHITSLVLPITKACNLACPYCFANSNGKPDFTHDFDDKDIESLYSYIHNNVTESETFNLIFFGGEPLVKFSLIKKIVIGIRKLFPQHKIGFSITTNGTLLTKEVAVFFKKYNFAVLLSIDGLNNNFNHRRYKDGTPSFPSAMRGYELLKNNGVPTEFRATLTCDNPYIFETYEFFENLRIPYTIVFAYNSVAEGSEKYVTFSREQIKHIENAFVKLENLYIDKFKKNDSIFDSAFKSFIEKLEFRIHQENVCAAGYTYFTMMHGGDLYSCPHLMDNSKYILGKLSDFEQIKTLNFDSVPVNLDMIDGCQDCWAKHLCRGGCTTQKMIIGRRPDQTLAPDRCELDKLQFAHYLKLYYHLKILKDSTV